MPSSKSTSMRNSPRHHQNIAKSLVQRGTTSPYKKVSRTSVSESEADNAHDKELISTTSTWSTTAFLCNMISEDATAEPQTYEETHVHSVYEQIASHFSSTRYKPWPIVESFLQSLNAGAIGLDVGCGNGKYLAVNKNVFIIASDRSTNLVKIATQHEPHASVVADTLALPHQKGRFDFAISIAVVHHLSTPERRREAVKCILECLKPEGKALIYVWALEQKNSRRGWDEGHEQDVMVPWVMKNKKKDGEEKGENESTFLRYYHLYRKGELEGDIESVGGRVVEAGYEKDNWWAICSQGDRWTS